MSSISKDYIFTVENKTLKFIGDFDGLYASEENPWGQDGSDSRLGEYYKYSRNNILVNVKNFHEAQTMLEIGCGLGFVVDFFNKNLKLVCDGADISTIALEKAKKNYNQYNFLHIDVQTKDLLIDKKYDIVVLNQVLWYVLEQFENVFENVFNMLNEKGVFIIAQSFLETQNYGKDIIDGFAGLVQYIEKKQNDKFILRDAHMVQKETLLYRDGCLIMEKVNE